MSLNRNGRFVSRAAGFAALAACLVITADVKAGLIFSSSQLSGVQDINLVSATNVATVTGTTNQTVNGSVVPVTFGNAGVNLDASNGAASITAAGSSSATFTTLTTTFQSGFGVQALNFNVNRGNTAGTLTLTGFDQFGTSFTSSAFTLGNGQTPFLVTAINGELLTKLIITSTTPLNTASQFAVTGVSAAVVPEPSTLAGAAVAALFGLGYARRCWRAA
ncbi:MAG: hypothetical protein LC745_01520 [Planctomycetia bacterium]|nr:hypothetical protein [Planctomycetia bacterium]